MGVTFQIYSDGRAAGSAPVSGSDFVTKNYLTSSIGSLSSSITETIIDNERVVAAALNTLSGSVTGLVSESVLSPTIRHIVSISSASYAAIIYPDPETLYILNDIPELKAPVTIYSTNGSTGLLGHNSSSFENNWQLQNLDLVPYSYIECYFKAANTNDNDKFTPAVVVKVPLDEAAKGPTAYFGSAMVPLPFNRNRQYLVGVAVDATKTKFQVIHQNTLWNGTTSDANDTGRYCYKIVGHYQ